MRSRLRHLLTLAMKDRDSVAVAALRSAIAAIDNAEAVEVDGSARLATSSSHIAGASAGAGSADVARRALSESEVRDVVRAQIDERSQAAGEYERLGRADAAERLRREASVLSAYLQSGD